MYKMYALFKVGLALFGRRHERLALMVLGAFVYADHYYIA